VSSIIEKPDGTQVWTIRLTLHPSIAREARIIQLLRAAPKRRLAATILDLMMNGLPAENAGEKEEEDILELDGLATEL
jgi:hypothetical protein